MLHSHMKPFLCVVFIFKAILVCSTPIFKAPFVVFNSYLRQHFCVVFIFQIILVCSIHVEDPFGVF